jgi:hypothetical protein
MIESSQMKKICICLLTLLFAAAYGKTYYCPKLPVDIEIGKTYQEHWFPWKEHEKTTWFNLQYYKLFPTKYHFQTWAGLTTISVEPNVQFDKPFIACCEIQNQEGRTICLYRLVNSDGCKAIDNKFEREKFICPDSNQQPHNG